ncbi:MAG: hypothetical protein MK103_13840, partial [Planctomycetes bacterium]|nr:hypothetical protein [Planctomycetota bacterium]
VAWNNAIDQNCVFYIYGCTDSGAANYNSEANTEDNSCEYPGCMNLLAENGLGDVLVVIGGIIPDADVPGLEKIGIKGIFQPGTSMQVIVDFIRDNVRSERKAL